jgi:hypothetical protein
MQLRKRIFWLIFIMTVTAFFVAVVAMGILYQTAFKEESARLSELAKSQSHLIESIFRFNTKYHSQFSEGAKAATLSQLIDSHNRYKRFSDTGELLLAEKQGDKIHFFFGHQRDKMVKPLSVPVRATLAEPMRLALAEQSGTVIGLDYNGKKVLAAYEHVPLLGFGIVAKVDVAEIRKPFIKAIGVIVLAGFIAVALGVLLFIRITNPMIHEMQETIEELEDALKRVKLLSGFLPICSSCKKIRDDKGYWNQIESYIKSHSEAEFSHGICPDCAKKYYPDLDLYEE